VRTPSNGLHEPGAPFTFTQKIDAEYHGLGLTSAPLAANNSGNERDAA